VNCLWVTKSEGVGLIVLAVSFQDFQPVCCWSTNLTDGRTDRQTTCNRNTALLLRKSVESRQTYCNEDRVQFFWLTRYMLAMRTVRDGSTTVHYGALSPVHTGDYSRQCVQGFCVLWFYVGTEKLWTCHHRHHHCKFNKITDKNAVTQEWQ